MLKQKKSDAELSREEQLSENTGSLFTLKKSKRSIISIRKMGRKASNNSPQGETTSDPTYSRKLELKSQSSLTPTNTNTSEGEEKAKSQDDQASLDNFRSNQIGLKNRSAFKTDNTILFNKRKRSSDNMIEVDTRYFSNTERTKKHVSKKNLIPLLNDNKPYRKEYSIRKMNMNKKCDLPLNNNEDKFVSRRNQARKLASKRNPSINHVNNQQRVPVIPRKRAKSEAHKPRMVKEEDISSYKNLVLYIKEKAKKLPGFEKATVSLKKYGPIEGFAVNTHTGYVRVYNEDRVSILLNAQQQFKKSGKINKKLKCSVFSVFDGHGGSQCSNFLKNNLHNNIVEQIDIENLVIPSIKDIYQRIDNDYIKQGIKSKNTLAGSTANTILVLNNSVMVINTGDSRTIFSKNRGATVVSGSVDHKPDKLTELNRIIQNGGELYRMSYNIKTGQNQFYFAKNYSQFNNINELSSSIQQLAFGPWRVKPGGLSLSRSFGDIESKHPIFGGKEGVITPEPDITDFPIEDLDFALLGCKLNS